jgi:hypothetical protein
MSILARSRKRWQFTGLCPVTLLAFSLGCGSPAVDITPSPSAEADPDIHPAVVELLELKPEKKALPEFVKRLEALAKRGGWQKQLADCKRLPLYEWDEARAEAIQCGRSRYVLVLLKYCTHTIPGDDVQTVILLDEQGRLLDRLACEINSRLSRDALGQFHTVIPAEPDADGAQLVIRLDGQSARGNFAHYVEHAGRRAQYYWGQDDAPHDRPTEWDKKGLCRIAIKDGKLKVLFPGPKDERRPAP